MVKVIVHIAKAIVLVVLSILCLSCGFDFKKVDGDGNVTKQERTVTGAFKSVSVDKGLEVIIQQGATASVTVEADQNLQEHIKTEVKGSELEITADINIGNAKAKRVIVTLPEITGIEAGGGSAVKSQGTLKADKIKLDANGGSSLDATLETKKAECEASSGSHMSVSGSTGNLATKASNGSHLNAANLVAENVKSDASSGGSIVVNPTSNLSADASSGASVYYIKTPSKLTQNASSGGKVAQQQ